MDLNNLIMTCRAEEWPNDKAEIRSLAVGESFTIPIQQNKVYKVGDYFQDDDRFMVTEVFHVPKKWWQFWKRRQIVGYEVTCVRDD